MGGERGVGKEAGGRGYGFGGQWERGKGATVSHHQNAKKAGGQCSHFSRFRQLSIAPAMMMMWLSMRASNSKKAAVFWHGSTHTWPSDSSAQLSVSDRGFVIVPILTCIVDKTDYAARSTSQD